MRRPSPLRRKLAAKSTGESKPLIRFSRSPILKAVPGMHAVGDMDRDRVVRNPLHGCHRQRHLPVGAAARRPISWPSDMESGTSLKPIDKPPYIGMTINPFGLRHQRAEPAPTSERCLAARRFDHPGDLRGGFAMANPIGARRESRNDPRHDQGLYCRAYAAAVATQSPRFAQGIASGASSADRVCHPRNRSLYSCRPLSKLESFPKAAASKPCACPAD
jgi:hypothetical protein